MSDSEDRSAFLDSARKAPRYSMTVKWTKMLATYKRGLEKAGADGIALERLAEATRNISERMARDMTHFHRASEKNQPISFLYKETDENEEEWKHAVQEALSYWVRWEGNPDNKNNSKYFEERDKGQEETLSEGRKKTDALKQQIHDNIGTIGAHAFSKIKYSKQLRNVLALQKRIFTFISFAAHEDNEKWQSEPCAERLNLLDHAARATIGVLKRLCKEDGIDADWPETGAILCEDNEMKWIRINSKGEIGKISGAFDRSSRVNPETGEKSIKRSISLGYDEKHNFDATQNQQKAYSILLHELSHYTSDVLRNSESFRSDEKLHDALESLNDPVFKNTDQKWIDYSDNVEHLIYLSNIEENTVRNEEAEYELIVEGIRNLRDEDWQVAERVAKDLIENGEENAVFGHRIQKMIDARNQSASKPIAPRYTS